jgi:hypothetical protein
MGVYAIIKMEKKIMSIKELEEEIAEIEKLRGRCKPGICNGIISTT